jgi:hypothetical protein
LREIGVSRVEQQIPFSADGDRRDEHCHGSPATNPSIAKATQGFVSRLMPAWRKLRYVEPHNLNCVRNFALNEDQVIGLQIWFEISRLKQFRVSCFKLQGGVG